MGVVNSPFICQNGIFENKCYILPFWMSQELSYHAFGENYFLQEELLLQEYTNTEPYDLLCEIRVEK